jgi:polysaccharide pyruvyl transferase WcaK-like protein
MPGVLERVFKMTSIAIVFANLKGNVGDFAILHAMLSDIRRKHPDCTVDVYSQGFVPVDQERLLAFQQAAPPFRLAGQTFVDSEQPGPLTKFVLRIMRLTPAYRAGRIIALAKRVSTETADFARYQAIYIAGGAQFTGAQVVVSMFGTLKAIAAHNDRIFSYPISVTSSLYKANTQRNLREDLARIRGPIIVRDSSSDAILKKLGLDTLLGLDCVFSLARAAEQIAPAPAPQKPRVLLVTTNQDANSLKNAVSRLKSASISCALLTTCAIEDADVAKPIAEAAGIDFLAPLTWQDAVAEMKASVLVVANRLHGLIFASFASVPVLPLTDRPKVRAVVNDIGLPLSITDLGDLNGDIVNEVIDRGAEIMHLISAYRDLAQLRALAPVL